MICNQCNTEGVKNVVLNKEFYYCRQCKNEITTFIQSNETTNKKKGYSVYFKVGDMITFQVDDIRRNVKTGETGLVANATYDRDNEIIYEVEYFKNNPFSIERNMFYAHEIKIKGYSF